MQLWASDAYKQFWEAELGNTWMVVVDAVRDHLRDDGTYIETHTHTGEPVRWLCPVDCVGATRSRSTQLRRPL